MSDFELLKTVRTTLKDHFKDVHLKIPPTANYPLLLIELEEIWTTLRLVTDTIKAKIKFKVAALSHDHTYDQAISMMSVVSNKLNGQNMAITPGHHAMLKLSSTVIKDSNDGTPKEIQHFYEAIVRG